jgi:ATP-dependent DNA ligase
VIIIPAPMQAPEQLYRPFTDPDWLYEIKFDGYRCVAGVEAGEPSKTRLQQAADGVLRVRLLTKAGRDCSAWFPEIGEALALLPGGPHVIDGEACVLVDGVSDFNLLQARARRRKPYPGGPVVTFCAFDLLVHDGKNILGKPLVKRKARLLQLLDGVPGVLFVGTCRQTRRSSNQ